MLNHCGDMRDPRMIPHKMYVGGADKTSHICLHSSLKWRDSHQPSSSPLLHSNQLLDNLFRRIAYIMAVLLSLFVFLAITSPVFSSPDCGSQSLLSAPDLAYVDLGYEIHHGWLNVNMVFTKVYKISLLMSK